MIGISAKSSVARDLLITYVHLAALFKERQCQPVNPPLWFRLKYLYNYSMDCCEIWYRH